MNDRVTRKVEVYENERYIPLSGWSSKGLLISDRSAFGTKDGSANFSILEEANNQLISDGMKFIINHQKFFPLFVSRCCRE